jgi:hypothetical protein
MTILYGTAVDNTQISEKIKCGNFRVNFVMSYGL